MVRAFYVALKGQVGISVNKKEYAVILKPLYAVEEMQNNLCIKKKKNCDLIK